MKKPDPSEVFAKLKARVEKEKLPAEQVYYELAAKLAPDDKEFMPRILARLANLDQARILAALPDPDVKPADKSLEISEAFAAKLKMDKPAVEKNIRELFEKGVVFPTKKGPAMARTLIQLHDAALSGRKYDEQLGRIYFDLWGILEGPMRDPSPEDIHGNRSEFRILPRWPAIKDVKDVQPFEDARAILKLAELIVQIPCGCKRSHTDRWCGIPDESCLTLNRTAQYNLDKGVGRKVSYDEAVEIIEKFDKLPVVHTTVNQREVTQLLCNCHHCCCLAFKESQKSRFIAEVNPKACIGCRVCLERCQFKAVSMKKYDGIDGEKAFVDPEICRGCGSCVITCKGTARTLKLVRPVEHIPESLSIY